LTLTPLRNAVIHSAWGRGDSGWGRGKIDLPPGIAKKLMDTPVFVGTDIRESRFRKDLVKSMRVERVSDQARNQKFKIKDERDAGNPRDYRRDSQQADNGRKQEFDTGRKQEIDRLSAAAASGNKEALRQARQLEQQQRKDARAQEQQQRIATRTQEQQQRQVTRAQEEQRRNDARAREAATRAQQNTTRAQEKAQRKAQQQPQGERVGKPTKHQEQPAVNRPQVIPPQPQLNKHEAKQQSQGGPKQERPQGPPAQPGGQGHGGGGGKGKGKGKP